MSMGEYISNNRVKLGYKNFSDMAKDIGVSSDFLLRLSKVECKDELKQVNVENLERVSNFLKISLNDLINAKISNNSKDILNNIVYINECNDVGIVIDELKQKVKEDNILIDGIKMNEISKQIFVDSLDIVRQLTKNKI